MGPNLLSTRTKMAVVALLYFSEGFPFGLVNSALSVYFRTKKISLEEIGLLSLLGLAWSLKLLWAPLVDRFGRRYFWIVPAQLAMAGFTALLAIFDPVGDKTWFWMLLAGICLASATQDIAADAYTIDLLEEKELGPANGIRSAAYRVALVAAGGLLVMAGDWIGWSAAFLGTAVWMVILALVVLSFPAFRQNRPTAARPTSWGKQWAGPIRLLFRIPNFGAAIGFILSFKCGEAMLVAMANPFWIDQGFSPAQIGFVVGTLGTLASIVGAVGGGSLTAKWGIVKALWVLGVVQATAGLGYFFSSLPLAPFLFHLFCRPSGKPGHRAGHSRIPQFSHETLRQAIQRHPLCFFEHRVRSGPFPFRCSRRVCGRRPGLSDCFFSPPSSSG